MKESKKNQNSERGSLSRRTFFRNSAVLTSGLIASQLPIDVSAYVAGDDQLKVALIGCGGRGTGAAVQALTADKNVQLVAMADAFQDRLEKSLNAIKTELSDDQGKIKVSDDHKFIGFEAYKEAIDLADVVILTTPPGFRPYHFEYAVSKDKHIFMEKPLATDVPGIRKMIETAKIAKEKKLNVVVGLQRHYENSYLQVAKRLHDNQFGDIVSGQVYWNGAGVWVKPREENQTEMEYQMRNWYYFNWLCGDHILEQHIHNIDVANWFIGDHPATAQGMGGRQVRTGKEYGEIFDHHFVEFTYPSGAVISSQCRHQPKTMSRIKEEFQTTKGSVSTKNGQGLLKNYDGSVLYDHDDKNDINPYQVEHNELFASIRSGGVISDTDYGINSTMTAILGRMATYSGELLTWEDAMKSNISLMPEKLAWDAMPQSLPDKDGFYTIPMPGVTRVI